VARAVPATHAARCEPIVTSAAVPRRGRTPRARERRTRAGYITFAAGSRDGRQLVVLAVNGVGPAAIQAMGRYLDRRLLCR
jgi:hypothetical protein